MAQIMVATRLLENYAIDQLSDEEKWAKFSAATKGANNEFSEYLVILPDRLRPPLREWREIKKRIFARDNYTCRYCGDRGGRLECDHIVPVAKGGPHTDDNLAAACRPCNRSKRDKTLEEWRGDGKQA